MKEKDPSKVSWKQMFLFTRDGNLQNMDFMYSFFLSIALLFIHFIIGNRLAILFERFFSASSRTLKNLLDIFIPALLCAALALLFFRLFRKKKIVLMTYIMLLIIVLVLIIAMSVMYDSETLEVLLPSMIGIFLVPALASAMTVGVLYRRWQVNNPDPRREEERELEQRNE